MSVSSKETDGHPERAARNLEGDVGVAQLGHRQYVGGHWEEIGRHQFDYLVSEGLKPSDCLLDIGCGSLRGGIHFIQYLEPGHYLGIDKEPKLIERGVAEELGVQIYAEKVPELCVSDKFEFGKFSRKPNYAFAQSLFTHLSSEDIFHCLRNLREFVCLGGKLYATFFEGSSKGNPTRSHSHAMFFYSHKDLVEIASSCGWAAVYIGDWGHPRNQMIMKYTAI